MEGTLATAKEKRPPPLPASKDGGLPERGCWDDFQGDWEEIGDKQGRCLEAVETICNQLQPSFSVC